MTTSAVIEEETEDTIEEIILAEVAKLRAQSPYRERYYQDGVHDINHLFLPDRLLRNYVNPQDQLGEHLRSLPLDINTLSRDDIAHLAPEQIFGSISEEQILERFYPGFQDRLRKQIVDPTNREIYKRHLVRGLIRKNRLSPDEVEHLGYKYNGLENPTLNDILAQEKKAQLYHQSFKLKCERAGLPVRPSKMILRDTCPYIRKFVDHENGKDSILVEESKDFPIVNPESLKSISPRDADFNYSHVVRIVWAMTNFAKQYGLIGAQVMDGETAEDVLCFRDFAINYQALSDKIAHEFDILDAKNAHGAADKMPASEYLRTHDDLIPEIFNTFMGRKMANVSAKNHLAKNKWRLANLIYQTDYHEGDDVTSLDPVQEEVVTLYTLGDWIGFTQNGWIHNDCDRRHASCGRCIDAKRSMRAGELVIVPEVIPGYVPIPGFTEYKGGITRKLVTAEALEQEEMDFQNADMREEILANVGKKEEFKRIFSDSRFGMLYMELHRRYDIVNVGFKHDDASHLNTFKRDFYGGD